jgi:hypothetical protein
MRRTRHSRHAAPNRRVACKESAKVRPTDLRLFMIGTKRTHYEITHLGSGGMETFIKRPTPSLAAVLPLVPS